MPSGSSHIPILQKFVSSTGVNGRFRKSFLRKKISTTYRYVNNAGKECWNGTGALKGTESLVLNVFKLEVCFFAFEGCSR